MADSRLRNRFSAVLLSVAAALLLLRVAGSENDEELWRHRNLGKAFYENTATASEAVDEFRKALELGPESVRERINYGLALLKANRLRDGVVELEKAQKQDPAIPHTWFNLGVAYKKLGQPQKALQQFQGMVRLVPDEPVSHYNLGLLYNRLGQEEKALEEFRLSAKLDPKLVAPIYQVLNIYRNSGNEQEAARTLAMFLEAKKQQKEHDESEDMDWCYYAEIYETIDPAQAEDKTPPLQLTFSDTKLAGTVDRKSAGMAVVDFDGDGHPDLLVWSHNGVSLFRSGTELVPQQELATLHDVVSVAAGDFSNDGLPDLCVLTESGPLLFANSAGKFHRDATNLGTGQYEKAVWFDYDHDNDLDLVLLGAKSALFRNEGEGGFRDRTADLPFQPGRAVDAVVLRVVPDTKGMDFAVLYEGKGAVLYRDGLRGTFVPERIDAMPADAESIAAADLDNDGWVDLAYERSGEAGILANRKGNFETGPVLASGAHPVILADLESRGLLDLLAGSRMHRNGGLLRLAAAKAIPQVENTTVMVAEDFNQDGRLDLAAVADDGSLHLFTNRTEGKNQWLRVRLTGVKNLKSPAGAEIEVKAGTRYQKQLYTGLPLLVGLGSRTIADTVRITWPNGMIQNQTKQAAGKSETYVEAPRLSGSCPMIFTWNGSEFQFLTDVLGVAPLGASAGDGRYFPVDHDEYVRVPGESMATADGEYRVRITEELHEVSYVDRVQLTAVDHPAGIDVFTNEKFKAPPFPEFRLFGVSRRVYPKAARDGQGRDVRDAILRQDRVYPDAFRRDYAGVAELHSLELDFSREAARDNRAVLLLTGWVDWADGSTFLNAAQSGKGGLIMPYLQVKDAAGNWRTVIEDMGIPAGKPKTIAVDLTGKFLSSSRDVRIVTNLCVYWDEAFLSEEVDSPTVRLTPVTTRRAELKFHGFSLPVIHPQRKQPEVFEYARTTPVSMWNPTAGLYTRYGEVAPLLDATDDRMVIMGSGDELRLAFEATALPPLPAGWKRDFLLLVDGWAKDADANTAYSQTVEPLPFHRMSSYPYPPSEQFPNDAAHQAWRAKYNTRPALRLIRPLYASSGPRP